VLLAQGLGASKSEIRTLEESGEAKLTDVLYVCSLVNRMVNRMNDKCCRNDRSWHLIQEFISHDISPRYACTSYRVSAITVQALGF
jgi:hypothetical protein